MSNSLYVAVDLGASSGRVSLVGFAPGELLLEEIRRFSYAPARLDGHLRWDIDGIFGEIKLALRDGGARARQLGRPIASIGVDGWGVDYCIINAEGHLLESPICYRDEQTQHGMERVFEIVSRPTIFEETGIQLMVINTSPYAQCCARRKVDPSESIHDQEVADKHRRRATA